MSPENSLLLIPSRISVLDPGRPRIRGSGHRLKFGAAQRLFASYWLCPRKERSPHTPQSMCPLLSRVPHLTWLISYFPWKPNDVSVCWGQMSLRIAIQGHRLRLTLLSSRVGTEADQVFSLYHWPDLTAWKDVMWEANSGHILENPCLSAAAFSSANNPPDT